MINIKQYTDENYVPISDLANLGSDFVLATKEYRRSFMEMIPLNDIDFVNIVETPQLIRKRFAKNVDIKGQLELEAEHNDFILEIAKYIVSEREIPGLVLSERERVMAKYDANGNDLTIVTNYLIKNIDKFLNKEITGDLEHSFPELSKNDREFIKTFNDIRLHYTIADYQSITNCSYETGRKSLERLSSLELYRKKKVGKKFVYAPTQKLANATKGGE